MCLVPRACESTHRYYPATCSATNVAQAYILNGLPYHTWREEEMPMLHCSTWYRGKRRVLKAAASNIAPLTGTHSVSKPASPAKLTVSSEAMLSYPPK